jgi:hypothetical protein
MRCFRLSCLFIALGVLAGCSATENSPASTISPPSVTPVPAPEAPSTVATAPSPATSTSVSPTATGTQTITVDPWASDLLATPVPTVSITPSAMSFCMPSRISERSDAYICSAEGVPGPGVQDFCIRNPSVDDEYACLGEDLAWQVLRGIPLRNGDTLRTPDVLGDYVYLELTDGTVCTRSNKPGMPSAGDYVFLGFCNDKTSYFTRFAGVDPPSDTSSPFGEGVDAQGQWLLKTGIATTDQLVTRSVARAYR